MTNAIEISLDDFAELVRESIGTPDIGDDKVTEKASLTHPTTTVQRTFGTC